MPLWYRCYAIRDRYVTLSSPSATDVKKKRKWKESREETVIEPTSGAQMTRLPQPEDDSSYTTEVELDMDSADVGAAQRRLVTAAIVGLPNAGKSSLLNALVGSSLAAVSNKPHTTRGRVVGAFTRGPTQVVFFDTPGVVPRDEQSKRSPDLVAHPWAAMQEAEVSLLVVDATEPDDRRLPELARRVQEQISRERILMILNKIDAVDEGDALLRMMDRLTSLGLPMDDPFLISATRAMHLSDIEDALVARSKPGDWILGQAQVTDRNLLWRVHEAIRQSLFENLHKEVPYAIKQRTVGIRDTPERLSVQQELHVPKLSQARLAVGRRGETVHRIALGAAALLERSLGKKVEISLHFKYSPKMPERDDFDD